MGLKSCFCPGLGFFRFLSLPNYPCSLRFSFSPLSLATQVPSNQYFGAFLSSQVINSIASLASDFGFRSVHLASAGEKVSAARFENSCFVEACSPIDSPPFHAVVADNAALSLNFEVSVYNAESILAWKFLAVGQRRMMRMLKSYKY